MGPVFRIFGIWSISLYVWSITFSEKDHSTFAVIYGLLTIVPGCLALAFMYALEKWILRKKVKWWALAIGPAYLIVAPPVSYCAVYGRRSRLRGWLEVLERSAAYAPHDQRALDRELRLGRAQIKEKYR
jgi:hypothetical protein